MQAVNPFQQEGINPFQQERMICICGPSIRYLQIRIHRHSGENNQLMSNVKIPSHIEEVALKIDCTYEFYLGVEHAFENSSDSEATSRSKAVYSIDSNVTSLLLELEHEPGASTHSTRNTAFVEVDYSIKELVIKKTKSHISVISTLENAEKGHVVNLIEHNSPT